MTVNEKVMQRRIQLGFSERDLAQQIGLTKESYWDIEAYPDEILTVTHLFEVKRICEVLKLDFMELFDIQCAFCTGTSQYSPEYIISRNELVCKRRQEAGISQEELADRLGFYEIAVQNIENDRGFLDTWSIELIQNLSKEIKVPLQVLLELKCKKCNR